MVGTPTGRTVRWFFAEEELPTPWGFLRAFLFLFFAGLVFVVIGDFFAWDEHAKRGAARLVLPVLDYLGYERTGQEKITIVEVDDEDLEYYGQVPWPLPYEFHAKRLREIARIPDNGLCSPRPAAIFIDLLFLDKRETLEQRKALRNTICGISRGGIPVFIASLDWAGQKPDHMAAYLLKDDHDAACAIPVGVQRMNDKFDATVWSYDVVHGEGEVAMNSAALAIFNRLEKGRARNVPREVPMALIWGTTTHEFNRSWMRGANEKKPDELNCRPELSIWSTFADPKRPLCPYNRVLPARALSPGVLSAHKLNDALAGRVVMYGMNVQSAADVFRAPVHGELPGVHLHAMALDNMYSFKGKTKREEDLSSDARHRSVVFTLLSLALLTAFMTLLRQRETAWRAYVARHVVDALIPVACSRAASTSHVRRYALCEVLLTPAVFVLKVAAYFIVGLTIAWIGYSVLDLGPIAWVEYALFFILANFLDVGPRAEDWVRTRIAAFGELHDIDGTDQFKKKAIEELSRKDSHR